jgi:molecular chaperone GrpE
MTQRHPKTPGHGHPAAAASKREAAVAGKPRPATREGEERLHELETALSEARQATLEAEQKRDEYLDTLRRVAADFDNYRKRQERDRQQLLLDANERLIAALLPVLDDLQRALDALEAHEPEKVRDGVERVLRSLESTLEREGLQAIDPKDQPFDPHEHEALTSQPADGVKEGTVVQVFQRGFRLGERVIRPARVVVAAAPEEPSVIERA